MIERLSRGACWFEHFLDLYPTRQAVHEQLKKLMGLGQCECVGEVSVSGEGRRRLVFAAPGASFVRPNQLLHDCLVMTAEQALGRPALRHTEAGRRKPDFRLAREGIDFEIDTGSMGYRELRKKRYAKYVLSTDWVVWVSRGLWRVTDVARLEGMRIRSKAIAHCAWFCRYADLVGRKWSCPVVNYFDREAVLSDLLTNRPGPSAPKRREKRAETPG